MPYIGHGVTNAGTFYVIDDLTMSSSTTYTLQVGSVSVTPKADNLLITLDGVIQHTPDAYTVSGSTITFASAPGTGVDFYGIIMGQSASTGQGSIGADELKVTGDGTANQFLASDGDGTMTWKDGGLSTMSATGDIIYRNASGVVTKLAIGSTGQFLTVASGLPSWATDLESYLPLAGGALTGAVTTNSTFDGRDVAADGVTADAALPKAGGTMTGHLILTNNSVALQCLDAAGTAARVLYQDNGDTLIIGNPTTVDDIRFDVDTYGEGAMTILSSGNVGIGVTAPKMAISIASANGAPATSGTTPVGNLRIEDSSSADNVMDMGTYDSSPYGVWIQGTDRANLATEYPLILQPNGGNVGIGTTAPLAMLDIKGDTDTWAGMAKIYLTDASSSSARRNWSIGNGGSGYGDLSFIYSNSADGVPADSTGTVALKIGNDGTSTFAGDLKFGNNPTSFFMDTSDDSDDKVLQMCAGGGVGIARGATIVMNGNEKSGAKGRLLLKAGYNDTEGHIGFHTDNDVERMRITDTGRVGIGTSTPLALLDVSGDTSHIPYIYAHGETNDFNVEAVKGLVTGTDGDNTGGHFSATGSCDKNIGVYATATGATNNYGLIVESGSVGIGTTAPGGKFQVKGNAADYVAYFSNIGNDANRNGIIVEAGANDGSGTTNYFRASDGDYTETGVLKTVSGTFQLADVSDIRLKENVKDTTIKGIETVDKIKVRDFDWKKSGETVVGGFIANELKEVYSPAVDGDVDAVYEDGKIKPMTVSRDVLVPLLVKAVQELSAKVTELENA
jgi:hypothetical protein